MENTWILLGAIIVGFAAIISLLFLFRQSRPDEANNDALLESQSLYKEATSV